MRDTTKGTQIVYCGKKEKSLSRSWFSSGSFCSSKYYCLKLIINETENGTETMKENEIIQLRFPERRDAEIWFHAFHIATNGCEDWDQ